MNSSSLNFFGSRNKKAPRDALLATQQQNLKSRAKRALNKDPHLNPLPCRERGTERPAGDALAGLLASVVRSGPLGAPLTSLRSAHGPGIAAAEQRLQVAGALLRLRVFELLVDRAVVGRTRDRVEDADRRRQRSLEVAEHEREREVGLVVNDEVALGYAVAKMHRLGAHPVHADAHVAILAEDERLAVLEHELMLGLEALVTDVVEGAVVEDVAVLQNLDERGAAMRVRPLEHLAEMLLLDI